MDEALRWIAHNIETGLRGLGHSARTVQNVLALSATNILMGAQSLTAVQIERILPGSIIYNLEDLGSPDLPEWYLGLAAKFRIWDSNPSNLAIWASRPCAYRPQLVEVGYLPEMRGIASRAEPEIDVLCFGPVDGPALETLGELQRAGANIVAAQNADPSFHDGLIANARIVLNLSRPETRLLDSVRTAFLLANSKLVVSEACGESLPETGGEAPAPAPSAILARDRLVERCLELLRDPAERRRLEADGYQRISRTDLRRALSSALSETLLKTDPDPRGLYLDMVQRCVLDLIYEGGGHFLAVPGPFRPLYRELGLDWPLSGHSMIGTRRMSNLRKIAESVIQSGVPGDFIETGVWRGGACIMMRAVLKAYGILDRKVWVADSFRGLPPPSTEQDAGSHFHLDPALAISLEQVQRNFAKYGLLDDQVGFLQGWFSETLPSAPINKLAILRLDGDLYESTMDGFTHLYDKVSTGGFIIVDDFEQLPVCKQATLDFRAARGIIDPIQPIDGSGVYWIKTGTARPVRSQASIDAQANAVVIGG